MLEQKANYSFVKLLALCLPGLGVEPAAAMSVAEAAKLLYYQARICQLY